MQPTNASCFLFAEFRVDVERRLLLKDGLALRLNQKAFELLLCLVRNAGQVLSKDELLETVWPGQFVEENNLTVQMSALRKALGETKQANRFILTIPGRGYSFVGEVRRELESALVKAMHPEISGRFAASGARERTIGRELEISEVKNSLLAGERLVTLTGAGGSGKTKLALAIAGEIARDFPGGAYFVELAAVERHELVPDAISKALEILEKGGRSTLEALKEYLRERRLLLVLDNFEQVLSAAPIIADLLDAASRLKILVTSREALNLAGEVERVVEPLAVAPRNQNLSAGQFAAFAAIELFAVRAREAKPSFVLDDENVFVVAGICDRLDGLPLAIELAAARIKLLSPPAILARLENALRLLTGGAKDLSSRQRTMRGAIEWSYELLDDDEKLLFRQLSVFSGGFMVESAEAIFEDESDGAVSTLDTLSSLIDKNLLTRKELADGGVRLRMLEVVRDFARECARGSGEFEPWQRFHAEHFLDLAEEADRNLTGEDSVEWLDRLESEIDNFRAALTWAFANDPAVAVMISAALRYLWIYRSHFEEGGNWLRAALAHSEGADRFVRFKVLYGLAVVWRVRGDYESAGKLYETALAEGIAAGDQRQIALSNSGLGTTLMLAGRRDSAIGYFTEGLRVSRDMGDDYSIAYALICLGTVYGIDGRPGEARELLEESLSILRRIGSKEAVSNNLNHLGAVAFDAGDYEASEEFFAEGLELSREVRNKINIIDALNGFAALAERRRQFETAARLAGAAQNLADSFAYDQEPAERQFCDAYIAKVRASLDETRFLAAFEEGRTMGVGESVSLVRQFSAGSARYVSDGEIIIERHSYSRIVIEEEDDTETDA